MLLGAAGAAQADELCDFVNEVAGTPVEMVKGEVLEEDVTVGNFTIYATQFRPPLSGFTDCVLEQRTKDDGALSQLLVCEHGEGEHGSPLPEARFNAIGERLNDCTDTRGVGFGGHRMWRLRDHELQRIDLVSKNRGAHLALVYPEREQTSGADDTSQEQSTAGSNTGGGICAALGSMNLEAAFKNAVAFGDLQQRYERVCTIPVQGAAGPGMTVQVAGAGSYEQKAAMSRNQELPLKQLDDLGREAFIVNESDLNVLVSEGGFVLGQVQGFIHERTHAAQEVGCRGRFDRSGPDGSRDSLSTIHAVPARAPVPSTRARGRWSPERIPQRLHLAAGELRLAHSAGAGMKLHAHGPCLIGARLSPKPERPLD